MIKKILINDRSAIRKYNKIFRKPVFAVRNIKVAFRSIKAAVRSLREGIF
ncbi:hypothetical protein [Chryseobacterium aquaeductus]|nr:hypothetical protein [Chryseobacterium aquaeductus]